MSDIMLPEAPGSRNLLDTRGQHGDCQFTIRGMDLTEVLKLPDQLMATMGEAGGAMGMAGRVGMGSQPRRLLVRLGVEPTGAP